MKWDGIEFFDSSEFDSPDKPGSGQGMEFKLIKKIDGIRRACGFPFFITSGFRTAEHNEKVGGKDESAHTTGKACDIKCDISNQRWQVIKWAIDFGIQRIGIGKDFIHLDTDESKPQRVMWLY